MIFLNSYLAEIYDESQEATYRNLKAAGCSKKVLDRLDHVSRIGGFGADPQNPEHGQVYSQLLLEGLSEVAKKNKNASKRKAQSKS